MSRVLYGIKNCDTVKKARAWLQAHGIAYAFHDYKSAGVTSDRLADWARQVGWEALLNRAGTTFRKLPETDKTGLDEARALRLMQAQPSLIKRPLLERDGRVVLLGFRAEQYAERLG